MGRGKEKILMETTERTTAEVLKGMLTEDTGNHFLDSGGAYGRNHEKNQGRDFESEKHTVLSFKYSDIEVMHNVYHWLLERLEYAPEEDAIFNEFAKLEENEDKYWNQIMEEFPAYLAEKTDSEAPDGGGIVDREGDTLFIVWPNKGDKVFRHNARYMVSVDKE